MIVHRVMNVVPFPDWAGDWCHNRKACMVVARIMGYQLDLDAMQRVLGPEYEWRDQVSRCVVCREWINAGEQADGASHHDHAPRG